MVTVRSDDDVEAALTGRLCPKCGSVPAYGIAMKLGFIAGAVIYVVAFFSGDGPVSFGAETIGLILCGFCWMVLRIRAEREDRLRCERIVEDFEAKLKAQ